MVNGETGGTFHAAYDVTQTSTIRPVLSLKPEVVVTSGEGTSESPYIISAE